MTVLSIVIANYNNGHLLKDCVYSILKDAPLDEFEILIIDDKSTDDSLEIIKELSQLPPVRFHCRDKNEGIEAAFNTGISLAKGEYLHLFAADDLYLPGALRTMLELIKGHPEISIFGADYDPFFLQNPLTYTRKKYSLFHLSVSSQNKKSIFFFVTPISGSRGIQYLLRKKCICLTLLRISNSVLFLIGTFIIK